METVDILAKVIKGLQDEVAIERENNGLEAERFVKVIDKNSELNKRINLLEALELEKERHDYNELFNRAREAENRASSLARQNTILSSKLRELEKEIAYFVTVTDGMAKQQDDVVKLQGRIYLLETDNRNLTVENRQLRKERMEVWRNQIESQSMGYAQR